MSVSLYWIAVIIGAQAHGGRRSIYVHMMCDHEEWGKRLRVKESCKGRAVSGTIMGESCALQDRCKLHSQVTVLKCFKYFKNEVA